MTRFYVGPMSKNVVDCVIEFNEKCKSDIFALIPSRRQVEYCGGYVGWTTKEFANYVNGRAIIERDHGGPGQGIYGLSDGTVSFSHDAKVFDMIHIDPWRKYPEFWDGLEKTVELILSTYKQNKYILFEVGTEESIRPFSTLELGLLLQELWKRLPFYIFRNIRYAVVQSGVGLDLGNMINTRTFNEDKLLRMTSICEDYGILSKEHNGDYLTTTEIEARFDNGLDAINIAPEFGQIETICYLDAISEIQSNKERQTIIDKFYDICYESKKWEKWVGDDFIPEENKEFLIKICGHYVLASEEFKIISKMFPINSVIREKINLRLKELYLLL